MKPIQAQKDPRITNISFDNFTGSICIITSLSDNDEEEEEEDLMLSSSQAHVANDLFKPHHHLALITQPILGARSRRKDKLDSLSHSRRSSFNDSPALILPVNQTEKSSHEKKNPSQESTDSGLDFSLSTNSSAQYPHFHPHPHRPLSALNEDSSTDDGFHEQPVRYVHRNSRQENQSSSHEQRKLIKKSPEDLHRSDNSLPKSTKSSRKKSQLNLIIEPIVAPSHLHPTDHSPSNNPKPIKPKSITPLGHYPNPEQIRAHINRSVIERQHPLYLSTVPQQENAILSKADQLVSRQVKQPFSIFRSNLNTHRTFLRPIKPILPDLHHEERINKPQDFIRMKTKEIPEPFKSNPRREIRAEYSENFVTSTPRRPFKQDRSIKNPRFQSNGLIVQSKTFSNHRKSDFQNEHPNINSIPKKSPLGSSDNSPRIQPMKIHSRRRNKDENNSNRLVQNRSPTSWAIICEHQIHQEQFHQNEHSLDDYITGETFRLTPPDEEELLDGRHVIPDIVLFRKFVDCASQTSSRHTQPFNICANDLNFPEIHHPENGEHFIDIPSHSSSSLDRLPIPVEKSPIIIDKDDLSTNYDSDDGWSNDSAELIYADEHYLKQKKKNISSSNSIEQQ